MSNGAISWWEFLDRWQTSLKNDTPFDWEKVAAELSLTPSSVQEFVEFFSFQKKISHPNQVEICLGATCLSHGAQELLHKLEQINIGKVPEDQINIIEKICFNECDRAPCIKEYYGDHFGKNSEWMNRFSRVRRDE